MNQLFRPESLRHHTQKSFGEILLITPISFKLLTLGAVLLAAVVVTYLIVGEYTKKSRVVGYLTPDRGLIEVFSHQPG